MPCARGRPMGASDLRGKQICSEQTDCPQGPRLSLCSRERPRSPQGVLGTGEWTAVPASLALPGWQGCHRPLHAPHSAQWERKSVPET